MKQNYDYKPNKKKGDLVIVSASRRTDIKYHAQEMMKTLDKYPPEVVHSVVIWTKYPRCILEEPIKSKLSQYKQVFVQLTITGLGGTDLEPNVPTWQDSVVVLPELIEFLGSPKRIRLRVDPITLVKYKGETITNSVTVKEIIEKCSSLGIDNFVTSFLVPYGKVKERMTKLGFELIDVSKEKQVEYFQKLRQFTNERGGELYACSVQGLPKSACIDGDLLQKLHPDQAPTSTYRPETRKECGCCYSIDIGWYNMRCGSLCAYCYANPDM